MSNKEHEAKKLIESLISAKEAVYYDVEIQKLDAIIDSLVWLIQKEADRN